MVNQCAHCGQPARAGARFCSRCGRPLQVEEPRPEVELQVTRTRDVVRVMSASEILGNSVRLFVRYFFRLILASLVGYALYALTTLLLSLILALPVILVLRAFQLPDEVAMYLLALLAVSLAATVLNAPLTLAVSSIVLADRFSFRHLLASVFNRRLVRLVLTVALQSMLILLGFLALIIPGIYLAVAYSLTPAAVMLEERGGRDALERSRHLVRGYWWKTLGLLLASYFLPISLFLLLFFLAGSLIDAVGGESYGILAVWALGTLLVPCFAAVVQVLLYYDLRSRRGNFNRKTLQTVPTLRPIYERI